MYIKITLCIHLNAFEVKTATKIDIFLLKRDNLRNINIKKTLLDVTPFSFFPFNDGLF